MELQKLRQYTSEILKLAEQYHATNIRVFGSDKRDRYHYRTSKK